MPTPRLPSQPGRRRLPRDARVLLGGVAFDALGTGLVLPFLVVYLHDVRGLALATVGVLAAVPAVVALVLLAPLGVLIDRLGPRVVQITALVSQCAGAFVLSQSHGVRGALAAQLLVGVGHAAFWPANQSLVAAIVPSEQRQRYFGLSFTLLNAGIGVGGLVAGLLVTTAHPATFMWIYVGDGLSFLVPLVILLVPLRHVGGQVKAVAHAAREAELASRSGGSYRAVLSDRAFRIVLVATFLSSFVGYSQMEAGWTAFARTVADASTRTIGLAFAVNTAAIVALQLLVLKRIDGRRRTRVLSVMSGLWALSWVVMGVAGLLPGTATAAVLLVLSMGVFALGETLLSPVAPALTNDLAPEHLRGRYNATGSLAFQVAAIVGPSSAGALMGAGLSQVYVASLLLGCGLLVLVLRRLEAVIPAAANGVRAATDAPQPSLETVPEPA
jgi:MFS family permease